MMTFRSDAARPSGKKHPNSAHFTEPKSLGFLRENTFYRFTGPTRENGIPVKSLWRETNVSRHSRASVVQRRYTARIRMRVL